MMGSIYMEHVVGIKNPRVGIVNIGVEEEKGNALVKETYPLLKENPYINLSAVSKQEKFQTEPQTLLSVRRLSETLS